jgi:superfamily II DNA or RNA helicase
MNALFPPPKSEPKPLRQYQSDAIDDLRDGVKQGHRRQILKLPTGAGKTRIAAELIMRALARGERSIFVVPRISLIEQTICDQTHYLPASPGRQSLARRHVGRSVFRCHEMSINRQPGRAVDRD